MTSRLTAIIVVLNRWPKKRFSSVFQHLSVLCSWGECAVHCHLSTSTASCTELKKKSHVGFFFHTQRLNGQIVHTEPHSKSFWGHLEAFHHCFCWFSFSSAHSSAPPSLGLPLLPPLKLFLHNKLGISSPPLTHRATKDGAYSNSASCRCVVFVVLLLAFRLSAPNEDFSVNILFS